MSRLTPVRAVLCATLLAGMVAAPRGAGSEIAEAHAAVSLTRVGSILIGEAPARLAAGGRRLVVATGTGVHVFDVSRPESPEFTGAHHFDHPVLGLVVAGDTAYVANSHDGLRRLDLSATSAPALTGNFATRGQAVGVAMSGPHLFVGDNSLGFDVVDGTGALSRVGEYLGDGFPRGIAAAGSLVFVADQPAGLIVVDVSTAAAPSVAGRLSLGRDPIVRAIVPEPGSTATALPAVVCMVSRRGGLQVVDVSDPGAPAVTATITTPGRPVGVAMWGARVFVASGDVLQAFDLTDPGRPALIGSADAGGRVGPVAVTAALVAVGTTDGVALFQRR